MRVIDKLMEKVESCVSEGDVTLVSDVFFLWQPWGAFDR